MKRLVTVVIAVFNPDLVWLAEQLRSVEAQDYRPIEVLACDDASDGVAFEEIEAVFASCFSDVPYKLMRSPENIGSGRTFEMLTGLAEGHYISYCDQDDIWLPGKTSRLADMIEDSGAELVYSDLSVIDTSGKEIAESLTKVRRRLRHLSGGGLAGTLLFRNFTNGTAMLMRTETAKAAIPFVPDMVADHWLTLHASLSGGIAYIPEALVKYREHGGNQSSVLRGVGCKAAYLDIRILSGLSRFRSFSGRITDPGLRGLIERGERWFTARAAWFGGWDFAAAREMWKLRGLGKQVTVFELLGARMPKAVFRLMVHMVKRGVV